MQRISGVVALEVAALVILGAAAVMLATQSGPAGLLLAAVATGLVLVALRVRRRRRNAAAVESPHEPYLTTIEALARAIEARDETAPEHIDRVQRYATALARAAGVAGDELESVRIAAALHDVGMLAVPQHILTKPGPLTPEEFQRIRNHPLVGADLVQGLPYACPVAPLIRAHHERWDGLGYPDGLKAEQIPRGARMLAIAEQYDALTTDRPYHKAMSPDAAVRLLKQEAGTGLDPTLVDTFVGLLPSLPATEDAGRRPAVARAIHREVARAHRELHALYEMALALSSSLGVADSMRLITSTLGELVPFSCCALFLLDEDGETLHCRYAAGTDARAIEQVSLRPGEGLSGWVARNRRPLVNGSPRLDTTAAVSLRSALVHPLIFHDRFIGTLALYHVQAEFYADDHRRLLERIAAQLAAVIANSMLFDQAQEDSLTDPLTALPNTRSLFMHLTRELARARRLQASLALLVIDVDDFKHINDRFGHHVGDRTLCEVARLLRTAIRPYDICARYAGDEFILVLSGCSVEEAQRKRLELQKSVAGTYFESSPGIRLPLSVSVGVALCPDDGDSYETLLATADRRMYQDKARRRARGGAPELPVYSDQELDASALGIL